MEVFQKRLDHCLVGTDRGSRLNEFPYFLPVQFLWSQNRLFLFVQFSYNCPFKTFAVRNNIQEK